MDIIPLFFIREEYLLMYKIDPYFSLYINKEEESYKGVLMSIKLHPNIRESYTEYTKVREGHTEYTKIRESYREYIKSYI